ncbi:uncharacterized protein LOC129235197 [Uloborus diversus]|uniref:uncharacterized protein LOC129235197 n=1 Tax=Uloborus diversus TaxID=327109 RepID=UPI002409D3AA|nr:uncharacterized protein LOC129235197 [Uloborus diversus]
MYYPPIFASVRPYDPRTNPLEVPVGRENPLDLSVKPIRPNSEAAVVSAAAGTDADDLMMLDHRKLANLAASHSLSAMGRQLLDPTLFRLGAYGADVALIPGLAAAPPFCFDRTAAAVPTSLAGHPMMSSFLQQRERCLEQQHQQAALYAARNNAAAAAQQQAAVAAAAAAYIDPSTLPLHLRNGLTQREAAAALAATRGLYAPALPTPMVLPAFSLYTEDKGAFTSLRNPANTVANEKSYLNGTSTATAPTLEAVRYAEHFQRFREQQHLQHHPSGKCNNACCTSNTIAGLGQNSVPCACCVQTPSQAALCARSPMGCPNKDPTSAATGKVCDFVQPGLTFLHRPTATTAISTTTTTASSSSELRLSVSSLCSTHTSSDPTTVSSKSDKQNSGFRPSTIWNAGLPSVSSGGKTAFSVPKKKESKESSSHYHKEHKTSGSIKDILKDTHPVSNSNEIPRYDHKTTIPSSKHEISDRSSKRSHEKPSVPTEDYSSRFYHRKPSDNPFAFHSETPTIVPSKHNISNIVFNGSDAITKVTNSTSVVSTKCEGGTIPIAKLPPLLEAVRPTESKAIVELSQDTPTLVSSPHGPPPLIAVSSSVDNHVPVTTSNRTNYASTENSVLRMSNSSYLMPSYKHSSEKLNNDAAGFRLTSKSPKKASQQSSKFNGLPSGFANEEPHLAPSVTLPKPIPQLPPSHLLPAANAAHFATSHYRPAQHQLNLQAHNGWIPPANPNVTVAPLPPQQPTTTAPMTSLSTTTSLSNSSTTLQSSKQAGLREPDYADTANVLQSLLIRSAPGMEPLTAIAPSAGTGTATSVITPTNGLPLFGLDYRYPFSHPLNLPTAPINSVVTTSHNSTSATVPVQKDKQEVHKSSDSATHSSPVVSKHSSKKRSNGPVNSEDMSPAKKRLLSTDFCAPHIQQPRYSFQPTAFANEAPEAPECPYTFIPEPPLNYNQHKPEDIQKPLRRDVVVEKPLDVSIPNSIPKSPILVPAKTPEVTLPCIPASRLPPPSEDRLRAIRARRRIRQRLLARICRQRRPLPAAQQPDRAALDRQLAVRHARKLLSQLTLRFAHRRYVHKWHAIKQRKGAVVRLRKKRRDGKIVFKIRKAKESVKEKQAQLANAANKTSNTQCSLAIPAEMKRLMVNKALGETTLHRAARLGYPEAVAYCLKTKCVSVNARDNAGYTPLHECCSRGHLDIARALLQYGADVNASAAGGIRPLHDAVENDHVEIVRLLLSYGADPTIATYSGLEPMKLARSPMMAEFLQGFFADISGEVDSRPHLPWRFWGSARCLDSEDCGYDVFDGVPSDPPSDGEGDNDFLFEVSDSPHLPTFRLLLSAASSKAQCNYLRLNDVLRKLTITKDVFHQVYPHIEILSLPKHEFEASATCSPLLTGTKFDSGANAGAPMPLSRQPSNPADRMTDNGSSTTDLVRLDNSIRQVLGIETISVR